MTEVLGLVEKPKPEEAPSNLAVIGRYILQPEVMRILDKGETGAGGEIQLTDAMAQLIGKQPFHAIKRRCRPPRLRRQGRLRHRQSGARAGARGHRPQDPGLSRPALGLRRDAICFETAQLGLAREPAVAHLAKLDRPSDHSRVERGIVVAQLRRATATARSRGRSGRSALRSGTAWRSPCPRRSCRPAPRRRRPTCR